MSKFNEVAVNLFDSVVAVSRNPTWVTVSNLMTGIEEVILHKNEDRTYDGKRIMTAIRNVLNGVEDKTPEFTEDAECKKALDAIVYAIIRAGASFSVIGMSAHLRGLAAALEKFFKAKDSPELVILELAVKVVAKPDKLRVGKLVKAIQPILTQAKLTKVSKELELSYVQAMCQDLIDHGVKSNFELFKKNMLDAIEDAHARISAAVEQN